MSHCFSNHIIHPGFFSCRWTPWRYGRYLLNHRYHRGNTSSWIHAAVNVLWCTRQIMAGKLIVVKDTASRNWAGKERSKLWPKKTISCNPFTLNIQWLYGFPNWLRSMYHAIIWDIFRTVLVRVIAAYNCYTGKYFAVKHRIIESDIEVSCSRYIVLSRLFFFARISI